MTKEDVQMLAEWLEKNKDHRLNLIEKEAVKAVLRKAGTVGELVETALNLLKKAGGV